MERKQLLPSYYSRHSDDLKVKARAYYLANKAKILEQNRLRGAKTYHCEACNKDITISNKSNHVRSFKHRDAQALFDKQSAQSE